jgi:hypothetical protein
MLPAQLRSRFRANPLLHVGCWLGVDSGNVVWNNYETDHYYFPVQFALGIDRPHPGELERVAKLDSPGDSDRRSRVWQSILARHASAIDVVVTYKHERRLDAVTRSWFHEIERRGDVRIFYRDPDRTRPRTAARDEPRGAFSSGRRPADDWLRF